MPRRRYFKKFQVLPDDYATKTKRRYGMFERAGVGRSTREVVSNYCGGKKRLDKVRRTNMPAADEDNSSADEIPYTKEKTKKARNDAEVEDDEDDMDDDEYVVEKILSHAFERNGKLKLEVKWEDWDETTWEPEANLDGCEQEMKTYFDSIGGRPIFTKPKGSSADSKKRKNGNSAEKPKKRAKGELDQIETPSDKFIPPSGSWEDKVVNIDTMERDESNGTLLVYVMWDNGRRTVHDSRLVNQKCPQKMLAFYEAHLQFNKSVVKDEVIELDAYKQEGIEEYGIKGVAAST